jgi:hypothetical protein
MFGHLKIKKKLDAPWKHVTIKFNSLKFSCKLIIDRAIDHFALWPVNHAGPDSAVPNFLADILHRKQWNADNHPL